ncbi:hypothetical protein HK100_008166, partial [Physocladia obscura]
MAKDADALAHAMSALDLKMNIAAIGYLKTALKSEYGSALEVLTVKLFAECFVSAPAANSEPHIAKPNEKGSIRVIYDIARDDTRDLLPRIIAADVAAFIRYKEENYCEGLRMLKLSQALAQILINSNQTMRIIAGYKSAKKKRDTEFIYIYEFISVVATKYLNRACRHMNQFERRANSLLDNFIPAMSKLMAKYHFQDDY